MKTSRTSARAATRPPAAASAPAAKATIAQLRSHRAAASAPDSTERVRGQSKIPTAQASNTDEPTAVTHPRLFTKQGERRSREPPRGVRVYPNRSGNGAYIEWYWLKDKEGEPVHDAQGNRKKGYIYSHAFSEQRATAKFAKNQLIATKIDAIRTEIEKDLAGGGKRSVLAAVAGLIDRCYIRVGNRDSVDERQNYGATTLLRKHVVSIEGPSVTIAYRGKSYVDQKHAITSWALADKIGELVAGCRGKNSPLFYHEGEPVTAAQVNRYLASLSRRVGLTTTISAKDFRSYHGTRLAFRFLQRCSQTPPERRDEVLQRMYVWVGSWLGHAGDTGTTKKHYVDPVVAAMFKAGKLPEARK